jgi:hypothetical protein
MYCASVPFRGWMGKTKDWSAFERGMVVGSGAPVCVKNCNAAGFFTFNSFQCVSRMVHHPKDIQTTWQLCEATDSTWASIAMECFGHLTSPCPDEIRLYWEQRGGCNTILGRCSVYSVYTVHSESIQTPWLTLQPYSKMYFKKFFHQSTQNTP